MLRGILMKSNSNQYEEIPNNSGGDTNRNFWDAGSFFRSWSLMKVVMLGMVILLTGIVIIQGVQEHDIEVEQQLELENEAQQAEIRHEEDSRYYHEKLLRTKEKQQQEAQAQAQESQTTSIPMPAGVNLGGWLSLEDYFFSGMHNSVEVATPGVLQDAKTIASCLPPLHVGSTTGPKWQSETDLFKHLMDPSLTTSGSVVHAIEVFAAHRASFIDLETDLKTLAGLGITTVRVPMGWCWTEVDPRRVDLSSYESDADLLRDFACADPFFDGNDSDGIGDGDGGPILWPAIPKPFVEDLLRACANAGLKASLDVHTYPGGTSIGTFSGVWPHWPRFWTHGGDGVGVDDQQPGFDVGHELFAELVSWMEDLSDRDPLAFSGLRGLSPMNEPAHLAGLFDEDDPNNFLPPLPRDIADQFLDYLGNNDYSYPDGTHLRVFYWFQTAIETFRKSRLPSLGKEVQVNIHESVFRELSEESSTVDGRLRGEAIATWWCSESDDGDDDGTSDVTTSPEERSDWAVLDMHHYHAWSDDCSGTIDGQDAAYACGDSETRSAVLEMCATWVQKFRTIFDGVCGTTTKTTTTNDAKHSKLMSAEFSAASHHSVRKSCSDTSGLKESYTKQVAAASRADVELFYWSYKMPYGGSFKGAGWSFTELMYKLGVLGVKPDTPQFDCDAHLIDDPDIPP